MRDRCPPHRFEGGWVNDEEGGVIFCRWCGEIRSLAPQRIEAPLEERLTVRERSDGHD